MRGVVKFAALFAIFGAACGRLTAVEMQADPIILESRFEERGSAIGQELKCLNDLGWYFHHVNGIVDDVTGTPVTITVTGSTVVNLTVGDVIEIVGNHYGNLQDVISISVGIHDQVIFQANVTQLLDALENPADLIDFLTTDDVQIAGEEILDITLSVAVGDIVIGAVTVADVVPSVSLMNSTETLDFFLDLMQNGITLNITDDMVFVNNVPITEILEMFDITVIGPGVNLWDLVQIDIATADVTVPPNWVIQMLDASAVKSPSSNFLKGNFFNFGNFHQCLSVHAIETEEQPSSLSGSTQRLSATTFGGKYCLLTLLSRNRSVGEITSGIVHGPPCELCLVSGACFPDSCSDAILKRFVPLYVNQVFGVGSALSTCSDSHSVPFSKVEIVTTILLALIAAMIIAGTFLDITTGTDSAVVPESKTRRCFLAFSVKKNATAIFSTGPTKRHGKKSAITEVIDCLFGIRFISMLWVLLGHTYSHARRAFQTDPLDYFSKMRTFGYQPILNGYPSVDTFFFISGLLASYLMLKNLTKEGANRWFFPKLYFHRYLRITPLYAVVILVSYAYFQRVGSGPMWPTVYDIFLKSCETTWWHNLLYVSTVLRPSQECVLHGWFLTDDMIYFLFSPLVIVPLYLHQTAGLIWCFVVFLTSIAIPALIHDRLEVPGVMTWRVLNDDRVNKYMDFVYYRPHTRFGVYVVGIAVGYLLHILRGKKIKLSKAILWAGWSLSAITGLLVIYGTYEYMYFDKEMDTTLALAYGSMHHQAFGFAVAWVVFACAKGYGGFVNRFLSWSAFKPLGNLSFSSYLVHWYVIIWSVYGSKTQKKYDTGMQAFNFIGNVIITHLVAFCAAVAVEFPFGRLFNIMLEPKPKPKADYYTWKKAFTPPEKMN